MTTTTDTPAATGDAPAACCGIAYTTGAHDRLVQLDHDPVGVIVELLAAARRDPAGAPVAEVGAGDLAEFISDHWTRPDLEQLAEEIWQARDAALVADELLAAVTSVVETLKLTIRTYSRPKATDGDPWADLTRRTLPVVDEVRALVAESQRLAEHGDPGGASFYAWQAVVGDINATTNEVLGYWPSQLTRDELDTLRARYVVGAAR